MSSILAIQKLQMHRFVKDTNAAESKIERFSMKNNLGYCHSDSSFESVFIIII